MKISAVTLYIVISALFGSQLVFAQDSLILQATPTEGGTQQGRVILDSDINEDTETTDKEHKGEIDILSMPESLDEDGDPDQPVISGQLYNSSDAVEGDGEDIGTPVPELRGIDNEDIGITDDDDESSGDSQAGKQVSPSQTKVIILSPSADDNANTHDPGITILEQLASIGIDDDEFGFISGDQTYVRAGFVKLGDIKGESSDDSSKGNAEANLKAEEEGKGIGGVGDIIITGGYSGKKPKEIVVVGSKTTDKASPKLFEALCSGTNATCEPEKAVTPDTLEDFAQRTANTFDSVNEIRMDDSKIEMEGTQPFKLFGFLRMQMKQTIIVSLEPDSFGSVKVQFPWYRFLGRKDVQQDELKTSLEKGISTTQISKWESAELDAGKSESTDVPTENVTFNFSELKAQILQTMSHTLGQYHESDSNFLSG